MSGFVTALKKYAVFSERSHRSEYCPVTGVTPTPASRFFSPGSTVV
ncbi:MAG TPA: hypothetical protein VLA89_19705 [Gemmatimonadales bacterium]|nr:hypothetical protein [Gemmatimonadales bacterium]